MRAPARHSCTRLLVAAILTVSAWSLLAPVACEAGCIIEDLIRQNIHASDRARRTPQRFASYAMLPEESGYPDTRRLHQSSSAWGEEFIQVGSGVIESTSTWLNMTRHANVRPGDIVLLQPRRSGSTRSLVLFYCGEESFPDPPKKTSATKGEPADTLSFFIYPYISGAEWNTFPPRQHQAMREHLLERQGFWEKLWGWIKAVFTLSFDRDAGHVYLKDAKRRVAWLKTPNNDNYLGLFHKDSTWAFPSGKQMSFRYRILRIRPATQTASKQGAFSGTRYAAGSEDTPRSIRIEFDPTIWEARNKGRIRAEKIGHVQVVSMCIDGKPARIWAHLPTSEKAKADYYREITTPAGAMIDSAVLIKLESFKSNVITLQDEEDRSPVYNYGGDNSHIGIRTRSEHRNAVLFDDPAQTPRVQWYNPSTGRGVRQVVYRFETWSWCEKGLDLGKWYDGLIWEYRITHENALEGGEVFVAQTGLDRPSGAFLAALRKYNARWNYRLSNDLTNQEIERLFRFLLKQPIEIYSNNKPRRVRISYPKFGNKVDIAWKNREEVKGGCQARAQTMCYAAAHLYPRLGQSGQLYKLFNVGARFPDQTTIRATFLDGSQIQWGFHVAPLVRVQGRWHIIDPSLVPNGSVPVNQWLGRQTDVGGPSKRYKKPWAGDQSAYFPSATQSTPTQTVFVSYQDFVEQFEKEVTSGVAPDADVDGILDSTTVDFDSSP